MAGPSTPSPSPSSGSDDFAALLETELQTSQEDSGEASGVEENSEEKAQSDGDESDEAQVLEDDLPREIAEASVVLEEAKSEDGIDGSMDNRHKLLIGEDLAGAEEVTAGQNSGPKRKRVEEENDLKSDSKGSCPPHPGFMWGVCIRCGKTREVSNDVPLPTAVALRYIHEGLEVTETEAARIRQDELRRVMSRKKLFLVLDLDHTLLNSARFIEVHPEEEAYLTECYLREPCVGDREPRFIKGLNRLTNLQMWTKIRPFAFEFIEAASKMFEMYVYTMGERAYALAMARLLDPTGRLFGDRIISQGDSTRSTTKDLDVVLGAESAVLILDDTEGKRRDESDKDGTLATALKTLQAAHHAVFNAPNTMERGVMKRNTERQDVREVLKAMRGRILKGCRVVFSRIFPLGMLYPDSHPFWRLTAELGAHCSTASNSATTHIIALDRGTDKANWAKHHKKHLVHPSWVEAAQYLWVRPSEEDFPVGAANNLEPPVTTFAKTVEVMSQRRKAETHASRDVGLSESSPSQGIDSIVKDKRNDLKDCAGDQEAEASNSVAASTG